MVYKWTRDVEQLLSKLGADGVQDPIEKLKIPPMKSPLGTDPHPPMGHHHFHHFH